MYAKIWYSAIIFTEVIANKPFSRDKPLNYLSGDLTQRHEYVLKERLSNPRILKAFLLTHIRDVESDHRSSS